MKIMVISPKNKTVFNFRGDLIKEFIKKGYEVVVTGPNNDFEEDIKALGAKLIVVPFVKDNIGIKGDLQYKKMLEDVMRKEKPQIIFSYTIKPVIYGSLAAKTCGIKRVYPMITGLGRLYTSNSTKTKILRTITKYLYKAAFKGCEKVIFQNFDDMELFVKKRYLPKNKCLKIDGSGVNMTRFECTPLPEQPVFLMISRIIREKGIFEYLNAARKVKECHPEVRFMLLGGFDSSMGAIREEEIKSYIEDGIIEFPGEVKDVFPILKNASVFVLPTYYREGIPRTILEAMACGKAVLTTDWVGTKEAVENGRNGFLVPVKDTEALADKMLYMIENYDETRKMGKESFEICKNKFDVEIINKKMLEFMNL
ncbi:MAG: glycosyltransferase family 4 protein [Clostridia bacterium]|nr:glycosyltransferase family 4 protein [Clostridia bacterium]